jgi:hypothetical protein
MSGLPKIILMAPRVFYGLALFLFVFNVLLPLLELNESGYSTALQATEGVVTRFVIARLVERAFYDALYVAGMGVSAQILIAIWRNTHPDRRRSGEAGE